ncbi:MAG: FAD/NAD(P)-binding protein [Thermomicrobiales bacterium]
MHGTPQRVRVGIIGGGPRSVGIIERVIANADLLPPGKQLDVLLFDVHPAGPGRIWRYDQSPNLRMNSLAEDVAVFTDASCQMEGPVVAGPTLAEWLDLVRAGEIPFMPPDPAVAAELAESGPQSFATRRLFSCYMRWYFEHVRASAPEAIAITEIRGEVLTVRTAGDTQRLEYRDGAGRLATEEVDVVIYAVGHTDSEPTSAEEETSRRAAELGLRYWPAHYAYDVDFDALPPAEPVLLRGLGLSFIDIVVRLTLDRGGREVIDPTAPPGQRVTYLPSGREPHIVAGSRRGVPYHSKITSHFHGERPGLTTTFLTRDALLALLDAPGGGEVDFTRDVWPLIVREMAYWHYREIFTGFPGRARGDWETFSQLFHEEALDSPRLQSAIHEAVAPEDVFSIAALDRPLAGVSAPSLATFQEVLAVYIQRDLYLRESEEHSETLAIFWATLASYMIIGETLGHPNWSQLSRTVSLPKRWHDFFSYLDSGPPASRLELVLALQRAGLLAFAGGDLDVRIDEDQRAFVASSGHQPEPIAARSLVDSFHPERTVVHTANPALRDLVVTGQGVEQILEGASGPVSTRKLAIDFENGNVLRPDGSGHARRFAIGDFTSGPPAGAFSRPNTNARIFRENDRVARNLLIAFSSIAPRRAEPTLVG